MPSEFHNTLKATLPVVETDRLLLRPVTADDAPALATLLNKDDRHFASYFWMYDLQKQCSADDVKTKILPAMAETSERRVYEMYAFRKTDQAIVGLVEFTMDGFGRNRVSYYISPSERRNGYASEAYAGCVNAAVKAGAIQGELYAHTDPENKISQKFLMAAGFTNHGMRDVLSRPDAEPHAAVVFTRPMTIENPVIFKR